MIVASVLLPPCVLLSDPLAVPAPPLPLQVAIKCNQLGVLYMNDAIPQHLLAPPAQQQPLDFF